MLPNGYCKAGLGSRFLPQTPTTEAHFYVFQVSSRPVIQSDKDPYSCWPIGNNIA